MIPTIIVLFELLGYSILLSRWAKIPLSVSPAVVAAAVVVTLYGAGFVGLMYPVALAIHGVGLGVLVGCAISQYRSRKSLFSHGTAAGSHVLEVAAIGLMLLAFYLRQAPAAYSSWDEFSHWGSIIKMLYLANSFQFSPSPLLFEDIPPGSALFIYFVLTIIGYSEGHSIFSYSLLSVLFLLPLIGHARSQGWSMSIVVGTIALYLVLTLGAGWWNVLIEAHLAVVAAGALVIYFSTRDHAWSGLWAGAALALLALLKQSGQSLALLIGGIILMDRMIGLAFSGRGQVNAPVISPVRQLTWLAFGVVAFPLLITWSWNWHVAANHLPVSLGGHSMSHYLAQLFACCASERETTVIGRFLARHFGLGDSSPRVGPILEGLYSSITSAGWIKGLTRLDTIPKAILALEIYAVAVGLSLLLVDRRQRVVQIMIHSTLAVGFCAYSGAILVFYLYGFSEYEGTRLASYARYHNVYLLMWILIVLHLAIDCVARFGRFDGIPLRIAIVVMALVPAFYEYNVFYDMRTFLTDPPLPGFSEQRKQIRSLLHDTEKFIPGRARVYVAWQGSNGLEFYQTRYEIAPRITNTSCFSIGKPMYKGDVWTCDIEQDRFEAIISNYDYFLVGNGLQSLKLQFENTMRVVPQDANSGLLKIDRVNGQPRLSYIDNRR